MVHERKKRMMKGATASNYSVRILSKLVFTTTLQEKDQDIEANQSRTKLWTMIEEQIMDPSDFLKDTIIQSYSTHKQCPSPR
jgi:hypothetical protein